MFSKYDTDALRNFDRLRVEQLLELRGTIQCAKQLVTQPHGWGRGSFAVPNGRGGIRYCAVGALRMADSLTKSRHLRETHLGENFMTALVAKAGFAICTVNDTATSVEETLWMYDMTIAAIDQRIMFVDLTRCSRLMIAKNDAELALSGD